MFSSTGTWLEHEQFESSISYPTDVLTDVGYTSLLISSLVGEATLALTPRTMASQPVSLVIHDGRPQAMIKDAAAVSLVPVPDGEPTVLPPSYAAAALVAWEPVNHAVIAVTSTTAFTGPGPLYPQSIRFQSSCVR